MIYSCDYSQMRRGSNNQRAGLIWKLGKKVTCYPSYGWYFVRGTGHSADSDGGLRHKFHRPCYLKSKGQLYVFSLLLADTTFGFVGLCFGMGSR
jgi:hypothetical protein